jgi:predicted ATPase
MITWVEASGYRCLREISQPLLPYQVLVGPNGSGKSTFLDVIGFLSDLVNGGVAQAVGNRSENFHDLVWGRTGNSFRLEIVASAPQLKGLLAQYLVRIRLDPASDQIRIETEELKLIQDEDLRPVQNRQMETRIIVREATGRTYFYTEDVDEAQHFQFDLPLGQSALANLPVDEKRFPIAVWLKTLLLEGIRTVVLDNELLRAASPPGQGKERLFDGLNLARLVLQLQTESNGTFRNWLDHVRTAIPDIDDVRSVLRPEDKHRYLMVKYRGGVEVPAWMVSDGTLRLLALTILAYLPGFKGTYLIEEPEVGVHPTALETIMQSLSSVYDGQVLITSHSPLVLGMAEPSQLLCFEKSDEGTKIIAGNEHPRLRSWKSGLDLSELFAAGVLG